VAKKKVHAEEHADETWLLPYSDLLTLLLALFIVMFAISSVDKEKFERLSQQLHVVFAGGSGMSSSDGSSVIPMLPSGGKAPSEAGVSKAEAEEDKMIEIRKKIEEEITSEGYSEKVRVGLGKEGLEISIQDVALFQSGEAEVLRSVSPLLLHISKLLAGLDNPIRIAGHTDNVPIQTAKFQSNWDLSAMRAINVMNFLTDQGGLDPERFSIQGYGQYSPKYDNATAEGRAKNRRVEIILIRKYPAENEAGAAEEGNKVLQ
jgi:chemotaxis protein MotB